MAANQSQLTPNTHTLPQQPSIKTLAHFQWETKTMLLPDMRRDNKGEWHLYNNNNKNTPEEKS